MNLPSYTRTAIERFVVTAEQMQQIEQRMFEAGMPVAALMEKVSGRITQRFVEWFKGQALPGRKVGVLVGPGHNGGDALVVARELHHLGYEISIYQPIAKLKPLTQQQAQYVQRLGIPFVDSIEALAHCNGIIDGCFGFGLERPIEGALANAIEQLNEQNLPIFSIDVPSGIHTDTGEVMGCAVKASYTACLGLWKRAFMQAEALAYLGKSELIDFDIPLTDIEAVLENVPQVQRIISEDAIAHLPLQRSPTAHKYTAGHLLLIAGSRKYAGAALLAGLGAMASGVGMLTIAVPDSIRLSLLPQLPGALLIGCEETESGAILALPRDLDLTKYDAIALGPGLTTTVPDILNAPFEAPRPLLLDADGLNILAREQLISSLKKRPSPTVLTPHLGEFKRLFPNIHANKTHANKPRATGESFLPGEMAWLAAQMTDAIVLLKGPRSAIAAHQNLWFNPDSTPALARGGSGDVLTGLMGGLMANAAQPKTWQDTPNRLTAAVLSAVWWHSQAAIYASQDRTLLGVDPLQLAQALNPALQQAIASAALKVE
ncbi:MAG: NAD(P)H-hydrate dehydratase [Cyanobacteria bacterium P01_D01_bin.105]